MGGGAFEGTRHLEYDLSGWAVELSKEINHLYGDSETLIERPGDERWLVLVPETFNYWRLKPGDYVARTFQGDDAGGVEDDILVIAAHGYTTGDGPYKLTEGTTLPTGLDEVTKYWVRVIDATTIALHLSQAAAEAGTGTVDIETDGTADNVIGGVPAAPAASVTDGYGSLLFESGGTGEPLGNPTRMFVMPAPEALTLVGENVAGILTYWWLP